jgi:hypothetical protein
MITLAVEQVASAMTPRSIPPRKGRSFMAKGQKVTELDMLHWGHLPPDKILEKAIEAKLKEVIIIGYDDEGSPYLASSTAYIPDMLWMCEIFKMELMKDDDRD